MLLINNINQFLDALNNCSIGLFNYEDVVHSASVPAADLKSSCTLETGGIGRRVLDDNSDYLVEVLCVDEGQSTSLEELGSSDWVYVVEGTLMVEDTKCSSQQFKKVSGTASASIRNVADCPSIGLHLHVK